MKHEVDLSKYFVRTDLAIETLEHSKFKEGIKLSEKKYGDINVTTVIVDKKGSKKLKKKTGKYITIEFPDVTDETNKSRVYKVLVRELKKMIVLNDKNSHVLVIGLGNDSSTADSLGPLTIDQMTVTNHLYMLGIADPTYQRVSAFNPSVMGKTGIETSDMVVQLVQFLKPDMVVVIDALASGSINRVNRTIQMTDTGIHPGSGVGNKRKEISKDILGVPVIAIGVPTVVDAVTIVSDTIEFLTNHYGETKSKTSISSYERENLLGLVGTLSQEEIKIFINDILTPIGYNLMVTTKEVDYIIKDLSIIISESLNKIFHDR
jgi:GPR endopeptidase